ncbi:MAG: hypothetical protein Greene041679_471 [Parcubacteria group bacterium Greene0416_79]|nr:MAG: hypothetical protein Greene041679_471 [Parcubacteria group bacterium Greene0416_79]
MFEDPKIKKSIVITLALLSLFLLAKFVGEVKAFRFIGSYPQGQSIISVSGKGEVVGVPDIATFSFSVTDESLVVKEAQDEAAKTTNAILAYLKENGVAEKDIKTSGYNLYPRYEYAKAAVAPAYYPVPQEGKRELVAYVVTQSVSVKVRDLGSAGKLLAGIGEIGATDVSGLSFDFDKRDELVREARDKAIKDARGEAGKLAQSLGVDLVRIISYSEGGYYPMYGKAMMAEAYGRGGDGAPVAPEIPVGEDKIVSTVSVTYEIK